MKRQFLLSAAALVLSAAVGTSAMAQKYPQSTVTLVTHSKAGGGTDVFLREMSKYLPKHMGAQFAVENVTGGSGAKAMAKLAGSPADGSIFYGTTPTYVITSLLSKPSKTYADLDGIINVFSDPQTVYVRANSPLKNIKDVIEASKKNPTAVKFGVTTPGSLDRQVMEKFKKLTGTKSPIITHDGGGELLISVLNGTVDVAIGEIQELAAQLEAGKVRIITTYTENRLETMPNVPTAKEQGVDLVVRKFRGLAGPKNTPESIKQLWKAGVEKALKDPEFKKWYTAQSLVPMVIVGKDYDKFLKDFAADQQAFFDEYKIGKGSK
jgi:putative tricarboxylic transport membrane protein